MSDSHDVVLFKTFKSNPNDLIGKMASEAGHKSLMWRGEESMRSEGNHVGLSLQLLRVKINLGFCRSNSEDLIIV